MRSFILAIVLLPACNMSGAPREHVAKVVYVDMKGDTATSVAASAVPDATAPARKERADERQ
jgi:hypothetical protein